MRKINAVLSILCSLLIIIHGLYDSLWMYFRGKISMLPKQLPYILMFLVVIHAIICIVLFVIGNKGKINKNEKLYKKENIKTLIQRITGILMIPFIIFHIIGMRTHLNNHILHTILHPLFFLVVYVHMAISLSKSFITLGIGNSKIIKIIDIVIIIISILLFLASVVGLCFVMYGSWQG